MPIITVPIISKALGPKGVGEYSYTNSVVQYFLLIAALGTSIYGSREIALVRKHEEKMSEKFWEVFLLKMVVSIVVGIFYFIFILFSSKEYKVLYVVQFLLILGVLLDKIGRAHV